MWEPNPEQRTIKEVCLNKAVQLFNPAVESIASIVKTAKTLEGFFYTDPASGMYAIYTEDKEV